MIVKVLSLYLLIILSALVPNILAPAASQEDGITVRTNDDEYDLEETVRVTGKVGNIVGTESVIVKWIKPDSNSITQTLASQPDGSYSATLQLDPEVVTGGIWRVEAAYSNWKANTTFVVRDPFFDVEIGGSNGSDLVFESGQKVSIEGTIFNQADSERVTMTTRNSDGKVFDRVLALLDKKEFKHSLTLEGSRVSYGEWTIDMRYEGGHRTALTFDVIPSPVAISTDKSSYFPGDVALIKGQLGESIVSGSESKMVTLVIMDPFDKTFKTAQAEVTANGTYVFKLELSGPEVAQQGSWKVVAEFDNHRGVDTFTIKEPASPVTVKTNMPSFSPGQPIRVLGKVAELGPQNAAVHLFEDSGILLKYAETNVYQNYSFAYEFVPDQDMDPGVYEILVTYDGKEAKTTFEVKNSTVVIDDDDGVPVISGTYKLLIDGHNHNVKYKLTGTEAIERMILNNQTKMLTMEVFSSQNGTLTVEMPRRLIDSLDLNGTDTKYVVSTVYANGTIANVIYSEENSTDRLRVLTMDFEKNTDLITITGTKVIPEFGALPAIALMTAIAMTVAIGYLGSSKYRTRNRI